MRYSTLLFGHYKPNFELREKKSSLVTMPLGVNYRSIDRYEVVEINKTVQRFVDRPTSYDSDSFFVYECTGNEKRAVPGDFIAAIPEECWKVDSDGDFNLIQSLLKNTDWLIDQKDEIYSKWLAGIPRKPRARLLEARWNFLWNKIMRFGLTDKTLLPHEISSGFNGGSLWHRYGRDVWTPTEKRKFLHVFTEKDAFVNEQLPAVFEPEYDTSTYVDGVAYPVEYKKKHRFGIQLDDLTSFGVNMDKMLNTEEEYTTDIEVPVTKMTDKLKLDYVSPTASFNLIAPRIV